MKAVIQRVREASVHVAGKEISRIGPGILTLLGVAKGDDESKVAKMIQKILQLRIFEDSDGKMNLSLLDTKGGHLLVSQFTCSGTVLREGDPLLWRQSDQSLQKYSMKGRWS
jgi:D-aminoacyl-tRNA deacylase